MIAVRRAATVTVIAPVIVVLTAVAALAFWKTTGTGTGTATAASSWTENTGADTIKPVVTAVCPTNTTSYATGNNGGTSWGSRCGSVATVSATDAVGVVSAAMKVTKGTACFTGTSFTVAQCTAAGPTGYPVGYIAATDAAGSDWTIPLTQARLVTAGTGSYILSAQAKDAAGNVATTLALNFSTT